MGANPPMKVHRQDFVNRMFDNPDNLDIVFTPKK